MFSVREILNITKMICCENWKVGISPFSSYIEAAFAKSSLSRRIDYINDLIELKSDIVGEVLKLTKILIFLEWYCNSGLNL